MSPDLVLARQEGRRAGFLTALAVIAMKSLAWSCQQYVNGLLDLSWAVRVTVGRPVKPELLCAPELADRLASVQGLLGHPNSVTEETWDLLTTALTILTIGSDAPGRLAAPGGPGSPG